MDAKCIKMYEFGSPEDVLRVEYKSIEPPKRDEVLVRMMARPINPSDLIPIRGAYSQRIPLPNIPGYEGVGIVEDVGAAVSPELIGRRVLPLRGEGTWQEFVKSPAEFAVSIPETIDDTAAAQLYINPVTAWIACTEALKLRANEVLLVNAAGSSLGHIFAQLSKILGFRLVAVTRNNKYTEELLRFGASFVIDTSRLPLHETVMELTNGIGADAAIDSIGGMDGHNLAGCLRPNGNFLAIGLLSGIQVDWKEIINKAKVNVNMFHLRYWNKSVTSSQWQDTFSHLLSLVNEKKLSLMPAFAQYELADVKKAIASAESSKAANGKVFLTSY